MWRAEGSRMLRVVRLEKPRAKLEASTLPTHMNRIHFPPEHLHKHTHFLSINDHISPIKTSISISISSISALRSPHPKTKKPLNCTLVAVEPKTRKKTPSPNLPQNSHHPSRPEHGGYVMDAETHAGRRRRCVKLKRFVYFTTHHVQIPASSLFIIASGIPKLIAWALESLKYKIQVSH